jgi:hypothetical protein
LQWHLQFFVVNNDACLWEHKDHSEEVPLLLQWRLQFFLTYIEACLFLTCSFSLDQVLYLCFSPSAHHHHCHPPPGSSSRHL